MDSRGNTVVRNHRRNTDRNAAFFPFGKEIVYGGGAVSLIANIIWIIVSGIPLAISALTNGLLLCLTIIGIPFGKQCFKMARLALSPFGAAVV